MARGTCFLCGMYGETEEHHIFGGARRSISTKYKATVRLCAGCHREDRDAVHRCGETRIALQQYGQRKVMAEQGWTVEEFRAVFGKNYLDEEEMGDGNPSVSLRLPAPFTQGSLCTREAVKGFRLIEDIPLFI